MQYSNIAIGEYQIYLNLYIPSRYMFFFCVALWVEEKGS